MFCGINTTEKFFIKVDENNNENKRFPNFCEGFSVVLIPQNKIHDKYQNGHIFGFYKMSEKKKIPQKFQTVDGNLEFAEGILLALDICCPAMTAHISSTSIKPQLLFSCDQGMVSLPGRT